MKHLSGAWLTLCGSAALIAQTTVTLETPVSPSTAEPQVTVVTVTGTGFPSGTIEPANVVVSLQPLHSGPSGTAPVTSVQFLYGATSRLTFTVPATFAADQVRYYSVSISGATSSGASFTSTKASLQINPVAKLSGIGGIYTASYGSPGQSVLMNITGSYTNFSQGATYANFGRGISVGGAPSGDWGPVTVNSPTSAVAQIVVSTTASYAINPVSIATGAEFADYAEGFLVVNWTDLWGFLGDPKDGQNPKRVPIIGTPPGGVQSLFGVTPYGGSAGLGAVYSLPLDFFTADALLYSFQGPPNDGMTPDGALVMDTNGIIYGTTGGGGSSSNGTVFSLTPPASPGGKWTETVLHDFAGTDGSYSYAAMVIAGESGGLPVLYGTTYYGGTNANGVVFSMTPPSSPGGAWTEAILHYFTGPPNDGANPHTALTPGPGGVYYGSTYNGGTANNGIVFQLTPPSSPGGQWTESVLYSFAGSPNDGANPHGDMVLGPNGVLYGTTLGGGPLGRGAVFSLTPPTSPGGKWTETVLYLFNNGTDASQPRAGMVMSTTPGGQIVLYGTTYLGGTYNEGTVFSLTEPSTPAGRWTENILIEFESPNSENPEAGLVMDSLGGLFGAAYGGGSAGYGVLYYLFP